MFDQRQLKVAYKTIEIGSDWIRLNQIGSDWIRLDQIGSDWIRLDRIESDGFENDLGMTWGWLEDKLGISWSTLGARVSSF